MSVDTASGLDKVPVVRIVCGSKNGRCGQTLAVVERWSDDDPTHPTVYVMDVTPRVGLATPTSVPENLTGETTRLQWCPRHDPRGMANGRGPHEFRFALLREPLERFQVTGTRQTLRWVPGD